MQRGISSLSGTILASHYYQHSTHAISSELGNNNQPWDQGKAEGPSVAHDDPTSLMVIFRCCGMSGATGRIAPPGRGMHNHGRQLTSGTPVSSATFWICDRAREYSFCHTQEMEQKR